MGLISAEQRRFLQAVNAVAAANPFLPELAAAESEALGPDFEDQGSHWSLQVDDPQKLRTNAWRICERLEREMLSIRARYFARADTLSQQDADLYEGAVVYMLYHRYYPGLMREMGAHRESASRARWDFYREFESNWREWLLPPENKPLTEFTAEHMFSFFFQLVRAFHQIFESIIGNSAPAARLRAAVWQSIFTHDLRRYRRTLYLRMGDLVTLVTGPSGTGKELVAKAIALSRYVPFDSRTLRFEDDPVSHFHPIHIAALSSTLVESELFGHRKGSFTGAFQDRKGWLETCPPLGAVFLDEIGELAMEIQVKLLRLIETRIFSAVGDSAPKRFQGKLVAATNRDLAAEIRKGQFREDLYYRLCSDLITTPSLRQQLDESPQVLRDLVVFLSGRIAGPDAAAVAAEAIQFIETQLPRGYPWPGNYRELEQCIRNILVRQEYLPAPQPSQENSDLFADARTGLLSVDELLRRYCTLVYAQCGTYEGAAERLGIDRRTVKAKVDEELLVRMKEASAGR